MFAAVVLALVTVIAVRVVTRVPAVYPGVTPAERLQLGSCLAESDRALSEYTVVGCDQPHPVQVFATVDVALDESVYAQTGGVLDAFADEVCDRYLEYRLFLVADLEKLDYAASAIAVPTPEQYAAGDTEALCVLAAEDGGPLVGDYYHPMP